MGRPKSLAKKNQIILAASQLFLRDGYTKTSLDAVSQLAKVSKQTVYSHFDNKDALLKAVIELKVTQYQLDHTVTSIESDHISSCLTSLGEQFMALLCDSDVIAMYKLIISESDTNPTIAALFYEAGPQAVIDSLTEYLITVSHQKIAPGRANELAVMFFNSLKGEHYMQRLMGLPVSMNNSPKTFVKNAVSDFLIILQSTEGLHI